jgi:PAS domain S-box-containing protein
MARILVVDDELTTRMELFEMLTSLGYEVVGQAENGEQGINMADELKPDLILMDIVMPGKMDGIDAAYEIKQRSDCAIVFVTGFGDPEYVEKAKRVEPFGYVVKPFDKNELLGVIEIALHKNKIERELRETKDLLNQKVFKQTQQLSNTGKQLKALMNACPDTAVLLDLDGTIKAANSVAAQSFEMQIGQFIGSNTWEILPAEVAKTRKSKIEQVIRTGKPLTFEDKRDGHVFDNTVYPVLDNEGKVIQAAIYGKDITRFREAMDSLISKEKQLQGTTHEIEETKTALSVLLRRHNEERIDLEERVLSSVQNLIRPQIEDLRKTLNNREQEDRLKNLEAGVDMLITPFARDLSSEPFKLTPMEIRVAALVKAGMTNIEMAKRLGVSKNTILSHRFNIRTKLRIRGKDIDLKSHLLTFSKI